MLWQYHQRIYEYFCSISLQSRNPGKTWQKCQHCIQGGGILIQTRMHANSDTHACLFIHACMVSLIQKRNAHACLNKDDIRFTSMDAIFKGSQQIKGTVHRCQKWMRHISRTQPNPPQSQFENFSRATVPLKSFCQEVLNNVSSQNETNQASLITQS